MNQTHAIIDALLNLRMALENAGIETDGIALGLKGNGVPRLASAAVRDFIALTPGKGHPSFITKPGEIMLAGFRIEQIEAQRKVA